MNNLSNVEISYLINKAIEIRNTIVEICIEKGGHPASSLSCVEILVSLYYSNILNIYPDSPQHPLRDRFILSKGHACLGYYSILCEKGYFTKEDLNLFEKNGSFLLGHPVINKNKGIEFSNGSLGMGLSLGIGVAIAAKKNKKNYRVFVLIGDGECNEGSIWEASMSAAHFKLNNITAILDNNNLQQTGSNDDIMSTKDLASKWRSFNWDVQEINGHDIQQIKEVLNQTIDEKDKPKLIICHTIKGKGIAVAENNPKWHHKNNLGKKDIEELYNSLS